MLEATFRDDHGAIMATMRGDEWFVATNKSFDRNFTSKAVEVLDERGDVAFHLAMCGYGAVLEGKFYGKEGRSVAIASGTVNLHDEPPKQYSPVPTPPDIMIFPGDWKVKWSDTGTTIRRIGTEPDSTAYVEYGLRGERLVTKLDAWFRYPSVRFLGVMNISEAQICRAHVPSNYSEHF